MATAADKFARLSALRPVGNTAVRACGNQIHEPLPATEEECMLARMIGATVAQTRFGSHLTVRNWHATPEFCAPSAGVIELLRPASLRKDRSGISPAVEGISLAHDPEKWLFLDTETTGI